MTFLERLKETVTLRLWGFFKVPMIYWAGPKVLELNDDRCEILIPLKYLTKNHFNSLYISAQVTGADIAGGLLALRHAKNQKGKVSVIFKEIRGDFKKRPEEDTIFSCTDGKEIAALVKQAIQTKTRHHKTVKVTATCPKTFGTSPVTEFFLTLSVKASN
ncbi:MAG: DUF4442 domain-containing protein [Deltaproteobacteria bacterium]|nr:DUF4442 domain-containing protein [Deltaproteobacteria bacterium]